MRTRILPGLVAVPLLIAACGGDDGTSRSEVIEQANAICASAERQAESYAEDREGPSSQEQVRAALEEDQTIADAAVRKLEDLDPTEEQQADFDRFVSGLRGMAAGNKAFIEAINDANGTGADQANEQTVDSAGKAKKAAEDYGLDDCPYETVSVQFAQAKDAAQEQAAQERDPVGAWSGTVTQYGPGEKRYRYRTIMTVRDVSTPGSPAGTVEYPTFPCAGDIQLVRSRSNRYLFRERITTNSKECTSGGRISSTVTGDRMGFRWINEGVEVLGTLKRR